MICRICTAQNLVPNGDFEQYSPCPSSVSQLSTATYWINPTVASPDYFNSCAPTGNSAGVPDNYFGYQLPHGGNGYAGLHRWYFVQIYREYIEVQLSSTLIAGTCYHFEMYINLSDNSQYTSSDIQAYFSDTLISGIFSNGVLMLSPQVVNSSMNLPDTSQWTLVAGSFTASGGENFLLIGNFFTDANTTTTLIHPNAVSPYTYVFIDDVRLTLCEPSAIDDANTSRAAVNIYPALFNNELNIVCRDGQLSEIILYDMTSRKLLQLQFTNSVSLNTEQLGKGIYIYEVRNKNGVIMKGKVVKE